MMIAELVEQTTAHLLLHEQRLTDPRRLVEECINSALKGMKEELVCQLSPEAWARVTLIYQKHFLDTGCDISVSEIVTCVLRDAINNNRMDMLTLQLAQQKRQQKTPPRTNLKVIKD